MTQLLFSRYGTGDAFQGFWARFTHLTLENGTLRFRMACATRYPNRIALTRMVSALHFALVLAQSVAAFKLFARCILIRIEL